MPHRARYFPGVRQPQTVPGSGRELRDPLVSGRTNDETPHRDAAPVTLLVPSRTGANRCPGEALHPGAHFARRGGIAALFARLAALETRADSRTRTLQHVAQK